MPVKQVLGFRDENHNWHNAKATFVAHSGTITHTSNFPDLDRLIRDGKIKIAIIRTGHPMKDVFGNDAIDAINGATLVKNLSAATASTAHKAMWQTTYGFAVLLK